MSREKTNHPPIRIMTTTLVVTQHIVKQDRGTQRDYLLNGPTVSEITEETEYIKQIRSTLAKVQPLLCKNESSHGVANGMLDSKPHFEEPGLVHDEKSLSFSCKETVQKMKKAEEELTRLEASRIAGAESVKYGAQKLQEDYRKRSEDLKKRQEGTIHIMQARKLEQEQKLKQSTDNLSQLNIQLQEKHSQIEELEKRVQRMEEEKKNLNEKKRVLKEKLHQMMSNAENTKSCVEVQTEISTLQERISHLDSVIHSQHQNLHSVIQQLEDKWRDRIEWSTLEKGMVGKNPKQKYNSKPKIEELNDELTLQDERIESLKEKIEMLQAKDGWSFAIHYDKQTAQVTDP
ncbi:hypothetical protein JD844_008331 [Phrynosoma platyrhinos]|uniref:Coiled-coil domain-containing protein 68 n=1 Tax=Phrynosoma platyrhinos TaxID=52577 RepID=A0ABQ7TDL5_PHRPL|nr:hypothetical protein JD844_008331 [Phrynosoma platyrhinos]